MPDTKTTQALVELNRRFYHRHAAAFVASRRRPWSAWERLVPRQAPAAGWRVLDVGCGQGRFARFVEEHTGQWPRYVGVDSSRELLAVARDDLTRGDPDPAPVLELVTLVEGSPGAQLDACLGRHAATGPFDLIVLFGVLHHLPGEALRQTLLIDLAGRLAPGGRLLASVWRLDQTPRFERKRLPWDEHNTHRTAQGLPTIDLAALEPGDHLLTWSGDREHPRYCHFPDDAEIARWCTAVHTATGLDAPEQIPGDGPGDRDNLYLVFRAERSSGK